MDDVKTGFGGMYSGNMDLIFPACLGTPVPRQAVVNRVMNRQVLQKAENFLTISLAGGFLRTLLRVFT